MLSGPPTALRGHTSMANTSDSRIAVRGGDLRLEGLEPAALAVGAVLASGTESDVALGVDLGSSTPAGTYRGSLVIGGLARPVVVRVEELVELDVQPDTLVLVEGRTPVTLRVRNDGNTTVRLAPLVRGRLRAHDAGRDADGEADGPDAELRGDREVVLAPGAELDLDVVAVVPAGLDVTRRHHAVLPVGPADLAVTVLPRASTLPGEGHAQQGQRHEGKPEEGERHEGKPKEEQRHEGKRQEGHAPTGTHQDHPRPLGCARSRAGPRHDAAHPPMSEGDPHVRPDDRERRDLDLVRRHPPFDGPVAAGLGRRRGQRGRRGSASAVGRVSPDR